MQPLKSAVVPFLALAVVAVAAYQFNSLRAKHQHAEDTVFEGLPQAGGSRALLVLPAGGIDSQTIHHEDEVYYILSGRGALKVGEQDLPVKPGSVIYVKAGTDHRFHDVEEAVTALILAPHETPLGQGR